MKDEKDKKDWHVELYNSDGFVDSDYYQSKEDAIAAGEAWLDSHSFEDDAHYELYEKVEVGRSSGEYDVTEF